MIRSCAGSKTHSIAQPGKKISQSSKARVTPAWGAYSTFQTQRVARLVHSKVILVTPAGIGRPIDEAAVNKALFDKENVEVIGVVMNKVLPEKLESITDTARRGLRAPGPRVARGHPAR